MPKDQHNTAAEQRDKAAQSHRNAADQHSKGLPPIPYEPVECFWDRPDGRNARLRPSSGLATLPPQTGSTMLGSQAAGRPRFQDRNSTKPMS
jgi:hypothetical protein